MNNAFVAYYCCPEYFAKLRLRNEASSNKLPGYFRIGEELVCYGRSTLSLCKNSSGTLPDAQDQIYSDDNTCVLPFDPSEVAANYRYERYTKRFSKRPIKSLVHTLYYAVRPFLGVGSRCQLQKLWLGMRKKSDLPGWPVDCTVDRMFEKVMQELLRRSPEASVPFVWFWPKGMSSCAIMTHDVETNTGLNSIEELMNLDDSYGLKSSFQLIPDARYSVTETMLRKITDRGFEVNCHDLKHDGHLFEKHEAFEAAAGAINSFVKAFKCQGFRSGALYRKQEWMHILNISYDMSVPNVARFDPQTGGCCTVMPYFIDAILELPVTTIQDYTLFHVLSDYSTDIWDEQIKRIRQQHGLLSFIVHPDYILSPKAQNTYKALLGRLATLRAEADLWIALPGEVNHWWRQRAAMKLVLQENQWVVEGPGSKEACVAHAYLENNKVCYRIEKKVSS